MQPSDFAAITRNVIAKQGFDEFLPTACLPMRREIRALASLPPDIDVEVAALQWATSLVASGEEFLVAFKISPTQFKVVRHVGGASESEVFTVE